MGMAILLLLLITIGYVAPPGASPLVLTSTISDSMTPGITQDEVLFITPDEPEVGDVILFQSDSVEQNVLHRVTNVTDSGAYITKGDANDVTDQKAAWTRSNPTTCTEQPSPSVGQTRFPFHSSEQSFQINPSSSHSGSSSWPLGFAPAIFDNTGSKRGRPIICSC